MTVLVVDDIASMRNILSLMLNRIGFQNVETAEDAPQALQKLEAKEFGLVISDWRMEGMTGLQLLNKIREVPKLTDLPIILVSAESSEQNAAAARRAGAQGYLVKPFRLDVLKSTITDALELKERGGTIYKGCTLVPQADHAEFRCHIFRGNSEIAVLPPHASRQGAIDEGKLWVDQIYVAEHA
jgi:two-component system chemotaxis response regulator CheY